MPIGTETINDNGYTYVRTPSGWRPKAHLVAEAKLGRALTPPEMVRFIDGDKTNFDPDNLEVIIRKVKSTATQVARLTAKIAELESQRKELLAQVEIAH
jgi:hypothetical protein